MFTKMLIANRGEIALRVARACRELGIAVVAVYSTADRDSAVVRMADESVHIGPPPPRLSYLHVPNLIEAAARTGADAIHPGYGFLSEDTDFAEICTEEGFTFVGPEPGVMRRLGDKARARALMVDAGLPLLPGVVEPVTNAVDGRRIATEIGFPVIIKAAAGGGGRGMTVVQDPDDFAAAFEATRATAHAVFRDDTVYVERYLAGARHVEVQVLCDNHGNGVHLGERDCSVQRRHQKLIEEAPAGQLSPRQRAAMGEAAVRGALSVGYTGVGTVEFLADSAGDFYFMEMNTRIQVEHPVTEMVTGIDLVREQILVAAGEPLHFGQRDIHTNGCAIECRVNAEDPDRGFAPTPGRLESFVPPAGPWTRVDSGYVEGDVVTPHYDSMLAKVIVWAPDRNQAITRMDRALAEFHVAGRGVTTTIGLHRDVLADPEFRSGTHDLQLIDRRAARARAAAESDRQAQHTPGESMSDARFDLDDLMSMLTVKAGLPVGAHTDDPAATLDDVGLDSLAFLQLQAGVQERYGIELPDDRMEASFGELVDTVNEGLGARQAATTG
jgi:acetyl-CoA carboxylase biotin carboxylase subunit